MATAERGLSGSPSYSFSNERLSGRGIPGDHIGPYVRPITIFEKVVPQKLQTAVSLTRQWWHTSFS